MRCPEYDALLARAGGRCEMCGSKESETPRGRLVIDHKHRTIGMQVRGLICDHCNAVMGRYDAGRRISPAEADACRAYAAASWHQQPRTHIQLVAEGLLLRMTPAEITELIGFLGQPS
jgi:hypothetical protein